VTAEQVLEDSLNPDQSELARRLLLRRRGAFRRCCEEDTHDPDQFGSDGERLVCGICMDSISEKLIPQQRKFGLLECCKHVFCIDCLRKWRQNRTYKSEVSRSCPECRQMSQLVLASHQWVEDADEKRQLFQTYRDRLRLIHCRFDRKLRVCPYGSACMYKHERPRLSGMTSHQSSHNTYGSSTSASSGNSASAAAVAALASVSLAASSPMADHLAGHHHQHHHHNYNNHRHSSHHSSSLNSPASPTMVAPIGHPLAGPASSYSYVMGFYYDVNYMLSSQLRRLCMLNYSALIASSSRTKLSITFLH
jgi:hypothetical protein